MTLDEFLICMKEKREVLAGSELFLMFHTLSQEALKIVKNF